MMAWSSVPANADGGTARVAVRRTASRMATKADGVRAGSVGGNESGIRGGGLVLGLRHIILVPRWCHCVGKCDGFDCEGCLAEFLRGQAGSLENFNRLRAFRADDAPPGFTCQVWVVP